MQGEFIIKIRATYNQMTKAEKKVADYILRDPRGMLFLSITELAEACSVGETSVFRFCKTMGAKGYQEFKMMLSLSLHEGADRLEQFTGSNLSLEDSFGDLVKRYCGPTSTPSKRPVPFLMRMMWRGQFP